MTLEGKKMWLSFPFNRDMIDEIKISMEGRQWHSDLKAWSILNGSRNHFIFDILTDGSKIAVYDQDVIDYISKIIEGEYHSDGLSEYIKNFWQHQIEDFNFLLTRRRAVIAGEMRTGKTYPTLAAIMASEFDYVWFVSKSSALRGLRMELIKRKFSKSIELLTYPGFKDFAKKATTPPGIIIFDECQALKTPTSQQFKAAKDMSDMAEAVYKGREFVIGLSGTPAPKDPSDWWGICEVIRPGFIRESSKMSLARRLGDYEQRQGASGNMYWGLRKTPENPTGWIEDEVFKLYKRLQPLVKVNLKKDCLDLPEKDYVVVDIKPTKKILRVARTIVNT